MMKFGFLYNLVLIISLLNMLSSQETDLDVNIIPSEKYKLNKRDLINLKEDIERQLMQRVFEIQANWDEREKLRHFAVSRPPVVPPWPIVSPTYAPDDRSIFPGQMNNINKSMMNQNMNSGSNGYSFAQKKKNLQIENGDAEIQLSRDTSLNTQNNNNEHLIADHKLLETKQSLENEIKQIKKEIEKVKSQKHLDNSKKEIQSKIIKNKSIPNDSPINYEVMANEIYSHLENKNVDIKIIKKMILGKKKNEIESLVKLIKEHPDIVSIPVDNETSKSNKLKPSKKVIQISPNHEHFNNTTTLPKITPIIPPKILEEGKHKDKSEKENGQFEDGPINLNNILNIS